MSFFYKFFSVLKEFKKYKVTKEEADFISVNSNVWSVTSTNVNIKENDVKVIVEGFLDCPVSIVEKSRIAKAIEGKTGFKSVVLVRGLSEGASNVVHIYRSFNIENFYYWWRNYFNPLAILYSLFYAVKTFLITKNGAGLISLVHQDTLIGDLVYDTLIRFNPNRYTIDKLQIKKDFRLIFRAFFTFYNNDVVLKKYKPKFLVTSHNVYAEFGLLSRQANKAGVHVLLKDLDVYKFYHSSMNINEHFLKISIDMFNRAKEDNSVLPLAYEYFYSRINGKVEQIDAINAYKNKKIYSHLDVVNLFNNKINRKLKNVIVMSHAFSDAPHVGEGILFKDYYDFLEKTLIRLNEVNDINCFVKTHPSSYMWNEKGGVEQLVENNNLKKIYILPNDFNSKSIIDIADCIVTAKGTAGLEFSCVGIPAVTCGKGYYHGFGITMEPNTIDEYYKMLDNISKLDRLDKHTQEDALILFYLTSTNKHHSLILPKSHILPGEKYEEVFRAKYIEMVKNFQTGKEMKDYFYYLVSKDVEKCQNA